MVVTGAPQTGRAPSPSSATSSTRHSGPDGARRGGDPSKREGESAETRGAPHDWGLTNDARLTNWETVHHLIRILEASGEGAAAELVRKLGTKAKTARELACRLNTVCERKKRAAEVLRYNACKSKGSF